MSKRAYQRYPEEFQRRAVARMEAGERPTQLGRALGIERTSLYLWKRKLEGRSRPPHRAVKLDPKERRIQELQAYSDGLKSQIAGGAAALPGHSSE